MFKSKWLRISSVVLSLALLIVMVSPVAASADEGPQFWFLDSVDSPVAGKVMEKGLSSDQSGQVVIAAGQYQLWLADEPTLSDCTFPDGTFPEDTWEVKLRVPYRSILDGDLDAEVGYYDVDGDEFHDFATWDVIEARALFNYYELQLQIDDATVPAGDYLALKVINNDTDPHTILMRDTWGNRSWVASPLSDPGYPTPELPTVILMGVGLLGLLGYIGLKRSKASSQI